MCELLAVSANEPIRLEMSWPAFRVGGRAAPHGWGVWYALPHGYGMAKSMRPLNDDAAGDLGTLAGPAKVFLGHARYRVTGALALENNQPFIHEPQNLAFAGTMARCGVSTRLRDVRIIGQTGPERLFRYLCGSGYGLPLEDRITRIVEEALPEAGLGDDASTSFVVTDGTQLCAFCRRKPVFYLVRRAPHPTQIRLRAHTGFRGRVALNKSAEQRAVIVASEPLTGDERWEQLGEREVLVIEDGTVRGHRQA
jgi:predicted glutamine amidotransferase